MSETKKQEKKPAKKSTETKAKTTAKRVTKGAGETEAKTETKKTKKLMLPWTKHKLLGYTNKENKIKDDYIKLNEEIKKDFFDIDDEDFDELPKLK